MNQLLHAVRQLEGMVAPASEKETLSFSFFNDAFEQMQQINGLLQRLQSMQIDEMKQQMEKLLVVLAEQSEPVVTEFTNEIAVSDANEALRQPEKMHLPGYRNPRLNESIPAGDPQPIPKHTAHEDIQGIPSLNDVIQSPPSLLDLKRGLSLNDRFLFQRELFHNDREEMNRMMLRLNAFESYEKASEYLKETMAWNFDEAVVKDFLSVIKKGFA